MKDFVMERLCRMDGKLPTAKERWIAFHRLWRIANKRWALLDLLKKCRSIITDNYLLEQKLLTKIDIELKAGGI